MRLLRLLFCLLVFLIAGIPSISGQHYIDSLRYVSGSIDFPNAASQRIDALEWQGKTVELSYADTNGRLLFKCNRLNDSLFYYREYHAGRPDILRRQGVIGAGGPIRTDTVLTFDPETYEEVTQYVYWQGFTPRQTWWEYEGPYAWSGTYTNGKRTGRWVVWQAFADEGLAQLRSQYYENDLMVRDSDFNLLHLNDSMAVRKALTGYWITKDARVAPGRVFNLQKISPELQRTKQPYELFFELGENNEAGIIRYRSCGSSNTPPSRPTGTWRLVGRDRLEVITNGKLLPMKLLFVGADQAVWQWDE